MTRMHGPFRNMGDFKAIALDYEYYASLSTEGRLYCLSDQHVYALIALCEYLGWFTRWYNTEDINRFTVQAIQGEVIERLMSCVDIQVLIDQAGLDLVNQVTSYQVTSQAARDVLQARYDGTPTSINPDAPTTNFGNTGARADALCAGLTAFVYQWARRQADSVRAGQIGGLAAVAGIAALLIPGLNVFYVAGASVAVLLGAGTIGVTTEVAIQALTDQSALDEVICCMRDNLESQFVSEANWMTALGGCGFESGSNAQIVADFLQAQLADNYLTVINFLGVAYGAVTDGAAVPECPCEPEEWCHTQDLKSDISNITLVYTEDGFEYATQWISGTGIVGARPGLLDENIVKYVLPAEAFVTSIQFEIFVTDNTAALGFGWPNGDTSYAAQPLPLGANAPVFSIGEECTFIQFGVDRAAAFRDPIGALTRVTIRGTGSNPFGTSNC